MKSEVEKLFIEWHKQWHKQYPSRDLKKKKQNPTYLLWYMTTIPGFRRLRQEDLDSGASLGNTMRLCHEVK